MRRLFLVIWLFSRVVLAAQTEDNEALAQKAVEAERSGNFQAAISAFEQLIGNGADSAELRDNLGIAYFQVREYSLALHQFQLSLAKRPQAATANLFAGLALLKLARPKEALAYLGKARRAQPDAIDPLLATARAELALNQVRTARAEYEQATKLNPQNAEAWYGLSIVDRVLAEREVKGSTPGSRSDVSLKTARAFMDASEQAMQTAIKLDPDSVHARMLAGESLRIAEQYQESIQEYKAATSAVPQLAAAWSGLAASYSASGDDASAQKAAARAHELDSEDPDTNALIGAIYLRQGDLVKAEQFAEHALKSEPTLSGAHVVMAKIDLARQQPQQAVTELQAAVGDDTDGSTHYLLATALRQIGKRDEAAKAMEKYKALHSMHVAPAGATH